MIELLKSYIEKRIQLVKFELIEVLANVASGLVSSFLILAFAMFIALMLSLSLAFWFSELLESYTLGFALVGGLYLLIFIIYLLVFKDKISIQVKDKIVQNSFKDSSNT